MNIFVIGNGVNRSDTERSFEQGMFCYILFISFEEIARNRGHELGELGERTIGLYKLYGDGRFSKQEYN